MRNLRPLPIFRPLPPRRGTHPRPGNPFFRQPEPIFGANPERPIPLIPPELTQPPKKKPVRPGRDRIVPKPIVPIVPPPDSNERPPKCRLFEAEPPDPTTCPPNKCWLCIYHCQTFRGFGFLPIVRYQPGGCDQELSYGWVPGYPPTTEGRAACEKSTDQDALPYFGWEK